MLKSMICRIRGHRPGAGPPGSRDRRLLPGILALKALQAVGEGPIVGQVEGLKA